MDKHIFSISEADSRNLAGGKAYALGEMVRAGFLVPDGFVLSATAFMKMTPSLEDLLLQRFDALQADVVAVRSSAINEDGSDAAWAGQLDTFINCTKDTLLHHIQLCWNSAHSARARSYAEQKALQGTKLAVIVQEMVQSDISGVAFSVHPVTNNDAQVVIEAGLGLGEAVVSGQITPDTYIVDKKSGQPLERHVALQKRKLARDTAGKTLWQDSGAEGARQKLSDEQIVSLCRLVTRLEAFFKHPVDVEWALREDTLYILQSRPITTLGV